MKNYFLIPLFFFALAASAQSNYAVSFDGVNDYAVLPNVVSSDFTIEYWMKTSSTGTSGTQWFQGNGLVDAEVSGMTDDWGTSLLSNKLAFGIGNPDVTITSVSDVNTGNWVHVAATWKQSTGAMQLYINGILEASTTGSTNARTAPTRITIGEIQTNGGWFNGSIDEVRIWNTVRTQSQIKANMFNKNLSNNASGLVAYYKMNDGSGTTATNSCTNTSGIDGTLTNGPLWVASPIQFGGNTLSFDGLDDYVSTSTYVVPTSGDFTVELWGYTSTYSGYREFLSQGSAGSAFYVGTKDATGEIRCGDSWVATGVTLPLNQWVHIAVVKSGVAATLYVNGIQKASKASGYSISSAGTNFQMGTQYGGFGEYLQGNLDEVRIWNVARTATEIQNNYLKEIDPATNANLVAYYTFNQGIASGTNTGLTTLMDQAGSNNGTLNGFSLSGSSSNYVTQNSSLAVLPLRWLSFTAQQQNETVLLQWTTASELNTNDFAMEHSIDGKNWKNIGSVLAAGNSNGTHSYNFLHNAPVNGINYYRIRQNDNDGRYNYSKIVSVNISEETNPFKLVANPVVDQTLQLQVNSSSDQIITLISNDGKILWSKEFSRGFHSLNVHTLSKGVYFLKGENYSEKLLVQ